MPLDDGFRSRPLVFVDDLELPRLTEADHHHLARALRVDDGAPITVGDGVGRWRQAAFGSDPEPIGPVVVEPPPRPLLTVAFTPVKGDKPEWFVQKLTELGVDVIVPVVSARCVVRWDAARTSKLAARFKHVAREAAMQSRRVHLPTVAEPRDLAAFVTATPGVVLADPAGRPTGPDDHAIVIGPEGGFSEDERALAPLVSLPGNVLRAGTAAITAGAVLHGFRSRRLGPSPDDGGR